MLMYMQGTCGYYVMAVLDSLISVCFRPIQLQNVSIELYPTLHYVSTFDIYTSEKRSFLNLYP